MTLRRIGLILAAGGLLGGCASSTGDTAPGGPSAPLVVGVAPSAASLAPGGSVRFSATVSGTADTRVTWTVREGSPGGAVSGTGSYTAPQGTGTFHVVATSVADPARSGTATVTVVAAPPVAAGAPVLYTGDRTQSPIDASVVQRWKDVTALGSGLRAPVFMKVGDSISIASLPGFAMCFDFSLEGIDPPIPNESIYLDGRTYLDDTILFFRTGLIGSDTPFSRSSLATQSGADASFPLSGTQPLLQELSATGAQFAVVMFGTNDVGRPSLDLATNIVPYEANLRAIADALLSRGVLPVFTTMPPRQDSAVYPPMVPAFNGVVRAIAQGRQFPLIDLNRELMALPYPHGMGSDGMHPSVESWNTACWFRAQQGDLAFGHNVRNLATIEALHRLKTTLVDGAAPPDPAAAHLAGDGTSAAPFLVTSLPFADMRDSRSSTQSTFSSYSCAGAAAAPGPEVVYQLVLSSRTALRAVVLDAGAKAVGLNLLSAADPSTCLKSAARILATTLDPGTYYFSVDGLAAGGGAEYTFSITECTAGDAACQ